MQLRQSVQDTVADVSRPYPTPEDACAEGLVGLNSLQALLQGEVIVGLFKQRTTGVLRQRSEIAAQGPTLTVDGIILPSHKSTIYLPLVIGGHLGSRYGTPFLFTLDYFIAFPLVGFVLVIGLCGGTCGHTTQQCK